MWGYIFTGLGALGAFDWWNKAHGPHAQTRKKIAALLASDVRLNHAPPYAATYPDALATIFERGDPGEVMGTAVALHAYPTTANFFATRLVAPSAQVYQ